MSLSHDKSSNECGGDYINNKNQVVFASDDYNSNSNSNNSSSSSNNKNKNKNSKDNDDDNNDIFVSSPTLEIESATKNTRQYDNSSDANDNSGIVYPSNIKSKEERSDSKVVKVVLVPKSPPPPPPSSPKNDDVDDSDIMNGDTNNGCSTNNNVNYNVNAIKSVTSNNNNISNITNTSNHNNGTGNIGSSINTTNKPYPADTYSFLSLYGPIMNPGYFSYGLMVYVFQMIFLVLMVLSVTHRNWSTNGDGDNPDGGRETFIERIARSIPANVSPLVRATQITAMLSYFIFADSTILDVVMAVELFPRFNQATHDDKIGCMVFSSILRLTQGTLATIVTLLLIITTPTTIEIILNFTAINFISTLDNVGFRIVKWGKYGPKFEEEAKRIETLPLPRCIYRKYKHIRYLCTVIPIGMMFFSMIGYIIILQENNIVWVTKTFRVQFQDKEQGLQVYNGCYNKNETAIDRKEGFRRKLYEGFGNNTESAKFSYCIKDRCWILFKGDNTNACEARGNDNELARSSKTDTFDVATMFGETWYSSSNTPLNLYFIEEESVGIELNDTCSSFIDDGNCDSLFNKFDFQYDGGDCCAATCSGSNCGIGSLKNAFGSSLKNAFGSANATGDGFPNCLDPDMVPITIRLDNITTKSSDRVEREPVKSMLFIDCDGSNVLNLYVDESMESQTETIMVNDGAGCTMTIRNDSSYADYTILHGDKISIESNAIVVAQSSSAKESTYDFRVRVGAECYLGKLSDYIDRSTVYTGIDYDPTAKAIDWLSETSMCEESFLLERYALAVIYFATYNSPDYTLISTTRQCVWPSIICDEGTVISLDMIDKALSGSIPSEIGMLTSLRYLYLYGNACTGSIPSEIGLLTSLDFLDLNYNDLTGSIPSEIGLMTSLTTLYSNGNAFTGSIPSEIRLMTSLENLSLGGNACTGSIPSEIGLMTSLTTLYLNGNDLSGSIPSEIGLMTSLTTLYLDGNAFTGSIPSKIGLMTSLENLSLDGSAFTGTIPSEIRLMTSLKILRLNSNQLTGSIPSEIGLMASLEELELRTNGLTGSIPIEIGLLTSLAWLNLNANSLTGSIQSEIMVISLEFLFLGTNELSGSIPSEMGSITSLKELWLNYNELTSTIPSEIGMLNSLKDLRLNYNRITGSIPREIGFLTSLEELWLDENVLNGSIPNEIGSMKSLILLRLNENILSGSIPSDIGLLTLITDLRFNNNQLTGSIPSKIGLLTSLESLILNNNQLTGSIPSEIGLLTSLELLILNNNQLTGSLPSEVGLLTSLELLILNNKQLTGSIPSEIGLLTSIVELSLKSNELTGSIPSEIGLMTSLTRLFLNDNQLTGSIPSEIGLLTSIVELSLKSNKLTGSIPSEIGLMTSLTRLFLNDNQLTGSIPSEIELLTLLELFWLNSNQLTGSFPSEIGLMTSLTSLLWNGNNFAHSIPSPASSPSPTSTCTIDIKLTGCPKPPQASLTNRCEGRPTEITFRYNGGGCAQSDSNPYPQTFNCTDSNGGPPPGSGAQSYITATALGGSDVYFAGPVKIGEKYTLKNIGETYSLNADGQFDTLSSDMTITIFESQGGAALQTTDVQLSCSQPLFLFDKFGANAITHWVEPSGRVVAYSPPERTTIQLALDLSNEQKPVRILEMTVLTNIQDEPIVLTSQVAGTILQPGSIIELPKFDIDLRERIRYTFFTTIIGETLDGTNMCNGAGFLDCTVGSNQLPVFPTMVPTPSPALSPRPTTTSNELVTINEDDS